VPSEEAKITIFSALVIGPTMRSGLPAVAVMLIFDIPLAFRPAALWHRASLEIIFAAEMLAT
jgi:hypothetical protein